MKMKFILSLVAAAVISSPVMALQVTKGKVISHKEWSTSGVSASYLQPKSSASVTAHGATYISASVRPVQAAVGENATITNDSYLYIRNESNKTHSYYVGANVCIWHDINNQECVYSRDVVEVEPGGAIMNVNRPSLTVAFQQAGEYDTFAETYFNDNGVEKASYSQSHGKLTVN